MWGSCCSAATGTSAGAGRGKALGPAGGPAGHRARGGGRGAGHGTAPSWPASPRPSRASATWASPPGLGLLACMASSFLVLPALLLALDRGTGTFAPGRRPAPARPGSRPGSPRWPWRWSWPGLWGTRRLTWEEDLRRFRQQGNPALALQETLGHALGAGPAAPGGADPPGRPRAACRPSGTASCRPCAGKGCPCPAGRRPTRTCARSWPRTPGTAGCWRRPAGAGLDPVALERPLSALRASAGDPLAVPRALQALCRP